MAKMLKEKKSIAARNFRGILAALLVFTLSIPSSFAGDPIIPTAPNGSRPTTPTIPANTTPNQTTTQTQIQQQGFPTTENMLTYKSALSIASARYLPTSGEFFISPADAGEIGSVIAAAVVRYASNRNVRNINWGLNYSNIKFTLHLNSPAGNAPWPPPNMPPSFLADIVAGATWTNGRWEGGAHFVAELKTLYIGDGKYLPNSAEVTYITDREESAQDLRSIQQSINSVVKGYPIKSLGDIFQVQTGLPNVVDPKHVDPTINGDGVLVTTLHGNFAITRSQRKSSTTEAVDLRGAYLKRANRGIKVPSELTMIDLGSIMAGLIRTQAASTSYSFTFYSLRSIRFFRDPSALFPTLHVELYHYPGMHEYVGMLEHDVNSPISRIDFKEINPGSYKIATALVSKLLGLTDSVIEATAPFIPQIPSPDTPPGFFRLKLNPGSMGLHRLIDPLGLIYLPSLLTIRTEKVTDGILQTNGTSDSLLKEARMVWAKDSEHFNELKTSAATFTSSGELDTIRWYDGLADLSADIQAPLLYTDRYESIAKAKVKTIKMTRSFAADPSKDYSAILELDDQNIWQLRSVYEIAKGITTKFIQEKDCLNAACFGEYTMPVIERKDDVGQLISRSVSRQQDPNGLTVTLENGSTKTLTYGNFFLASLETILGDIHQFEIVGLKNPPDPLVRQTAAKSVLSLLTNISVAEWNKLVTSVEFYGTEITLKLKEGEMAQGRILDVLGSSKLPASVKFKLKPVGKTKTTPPVNIYQIQSGLLAFSDQNSTRLTYASGLLKTAEQLETATGKVLVKDTYAKNSKVGSTTYAYKITRTILSPADADPNSYKVYLKKYNGFTLAGMPALIEELPSGVKSSFAYVNTTASCTPGNTVLCPGLKLKLSSIKRVDSNGLSLSTTTLKTGESLRLRPAAGAEKIIDTPKETPLIKILDLLRAAAG